MGENTDRLWLPVGYLLVNCWLTDGYLSVNWWLLIRLTKTGLRQANCNNWNSIDCVKELSIIQKGMSS